MVPMAGSGCQGVSLRFSQSGGSRGDYSSSLSHTALRSNGSTAIICRELIRTTRLAPFVIVHEYCRVVSGAAVRE